MFSNQIMLNLCPKICPKFYCTYCDYGTSKKSSFTNHNESIKHKSTIGNQIMPKICSEFICINCNKTYKDNSGLWRHKKKCILENNSNTIIEAHIEVNKESDQDKNPNDKDDIIMLLLKQNSDLIKEQADIKQIILEIVKNGTTNNNTNTINNTNSYNKAFNLNFFLNETCKNAMNITEFVDSINLELSDLMELGEIGYVASMSKIITKNLNALDETIRPIHCTDKKRETFYIKDDDKWGKRRPRNETVTKTYFQNLK